MILDSSAAVSVILREQGHKRLVSAMRAASRLYIGAPTQFETDVVVISRFDSRGRDLVTRFLEENEVLVVPFDDRHWDLAAEAFIRYGKGRHPARLNYGDCMTYATARLAEDPLLCVGNDFARTDLPLVSA